MAGSLQGPPFKTPSQCIRNSANSDCQESAPNLVDLLQRRRQQHQRHSHYQHFHQLQHQHSGQQSCKKIRHPEQQRKGKQVKHCRTFSKLSNGCIPRLGGYSNYVTATAAPSSTATEHVLESIVQITSSRFKTLASDGTYLPVVNHNSQLSSTFCVSAKLFQ